MTDQFTTDLKNLLVLSEKATRGKWHPRPENRIHASCNYLQADGKTIADFRYKNGDLDMALTADLKNFIDTHRSVLEGMTK